MDAPFYISLAANAALLIGGMVQTLRVGLWRQEARELREELSDELAYRKQLHKRIRDYSLAEHRRALQRAEALAKANAVNQARRDELRAAAAAFGVPVVKRVAG